MRDDYDDSFGLKDSLVYFFFGVYIFCYEL